MWDGSGWHMFTIFEHVMNQSCDEQFDEWIFCNDLVSGCVWVHQTHCHDIFFVEVSLISYEKNPHDIMFIIYGEW